MRRDSQENQLHFNHEMRHFGLVSIYSGCPLSDLFVFTRTCCGLVESGTSGKKSPELSWGRLAGWATP